jgi:hypothetical protein
VSSMQGGRVYGDIIWQGHGMSRTFALNELSFDFKLRAASGKRVSMGFQS